MISALAVATSGPAHADETGDLPALVEAQSAEIRLLRARIEALENRAAPVQPAAPIVQLPTAARSGKTPTPVAVRWSPGPEFVSADGAFRFKPRARIYMDGSWTDGSEAPARNISGSEVRALWMGVEGQAGKFNYALTADFANNETNIRSAYVAWRDRTPVGDVEITLGNRLTERSLEGSSSSEGAPFMERNAVALAISPTRGLYGFGLAGKVYGEGWHVAAQVAGDDINNNPGTSRDTVSTAVRAHWNPVRGESGVIHLGAWGFHESFSSSVTRLTRTTPWAGHFNDNLTVPLGGVDDPSESLAWGLEAGGVRGPGWAFAEYGERRIEGEPVSATVSAWSISAGWSLTGDAPGYSPRSGSWVRTRPDHPLSEGGIGAIEIVGRAQRLDNTDAPGGGLGEEVALGLNWKPEEWMRLMLDASLWRTEAQAGAYAGKDRGQAVNGRLQLSF
ncbi:OprO/OprP family phosphate-selective porin [Phenylobacterium sp. VNQ135]|uniref:OprO/OprP family phosphate-selective porin n=1 Tax=Phenylobacterium sp. VNQ135 TaxID=3400922 RepID=UPI003C08AE9F